MPTAMPISRITLPVASPIGTRCEASVDRPMAAATEESASSTGTPAAISAPNAMIRMSRVTGRLSISAFWKSLPRVSSSALLIDGPPTSSTRSSGWACWTSAVAARSGSTRSDAVSGSPDMVIGTSSAEPSRAGTGSATEATPVTPDSFAVASAATLAAAAWSSLPERAVISTFSTAGWSANLPSSIIT